MKNKGHITDLITAGRTLLAGLRSIIRYRLLPVWCGLFIIPCCTESEVSVNPSYIRIYAHDGETVENIYTLSAEATSDNGMVLFGLCGTVPLPGIFAEEGNLYVMKIDAAGLLEWDTCLTQFGNGYPSNLVSMGDDRYVGFWNKLNNTATQAFELQTDAKGVVETKVSTLRDDPACGTCNFIVHASPDQSQDAFVVAGIGTDNLAAKIVYVARVERDFSHKTILSKRPFEPDSLGISSEDDLTITAAVYDYLQVIGSGEDTETSSDRYFSAGPSGDAMTVSYLGELSSVYRSSDYWIKSILPLGTDRATMLLTSPDQSGTPAYFMASFDTDTTQTFETIQATYLSKQDESTLQALEDLDVSSTVRMKWFNNYWIVAGTNVSNHTTLYIFDAEGVFLRSVVLGSGSGTYRLTDVTESHDGQHLLVSGFTQIDFAVQRAFVIRLPIGDLF